MHKLIYLALSLVLVGLTAQSQPVNSKTLETSLPCSPNSTIFLETARRIVTIRTTHDNKVKLVTTISYQGTPNFNDSVWMEKIGLTMSGMGNAILIKAGNIGPGGPLKKVHGTMPKLDTTRDASEVFDAAGNLVNSKKGIRRNVTLYIPEKANLYIDCQYGDIIIDNDMPMVNAKINGGTATLKDVRKFVLTGGYMALFAQNMNDATINVTSSRITAKRIGQLDIRSKNSKLDVDAVRTMKIASEIDDYQLVEAGGIWGTISYGGLRVASLQDSLDLSGMNADIKLWEIKPSVSLIKIEDRYADLSLPTGDLKNYSVRFQGADGTLYTPFDRPPATDTAFRKTIGTGKSTLFDIRCDKCTLDMK